MAEQFPRQFGKYVLLKSFARGGMGEIYLAASGQPAGFTKLCVIKKVITEKTEPAKVNRFLDEAKVVLRLSHGNLVSTFDAGEVSGELYIAMELVEGKDLREIWNRCVRTRTRIPVDVALVVVREVARALAYVHSYGGLRLVHRDVAPPNILLSYFGEVKLTDFGLARSVLKQEHTAPGVVFGRASYLAPEQARGEVADARTDVYSLGIVLWELLTGQPYLQLAGLDPVTSLSLVRNPKTQPPSTRAPWIVPDLDAVVMRALAADRSVRYQSAEEMRRELADVMTRLAPRADEERIAEFLRGLYGEVVREESAERDRLLTETVPSFRGWLAPDPLTPSTDVVPLAAVAGAAASSPDPAAPAAAPLARLDDGTAAPVSVGVPAPPAAAGDERTDAAAAPLAGGGHALGDGEGDETIPGATPPTAADEGTAPATAEAAPKESLARSALRARAGSHMRRTSGDSSGGDGPTKVWRKDKGIQRDDAIGAQTFVGRVIDSRYRVLSRIGEGGMGTVYAAEHVEIGKRVAVKILHRIFSGEEQLVERFRREARAASKVGHPHIIDVSDFGTTEEGCAYFVMELLEGLDLADVLVNEGRLDPSRAVRISVQLCQALEAAHTAGIIHRDLKPENVFLVSRDGKADFAKVLDFGIARNLFGESQRLTNPGMAMGTPEYMAPEQALGRPADRRTDIYAVGALLHEMVMGVAPFKADSPQAMLDAKRRPLESLRIARPELPPALDAIILKTLAADPDHRPQTMTQLEYELAKIAWGRPQAVADLLGLRATPSRTMDVIDAVPEVRSGEPTDRNGKAKAGGRGAPRGTVRPRNRTLPRNEGRAAPTERKASGKSRAAREASSADSATPPPTTASGVVSGRTPGTAGAPPSPGDNPLLAPLPLSAPDIEKMLENLSPPPELIAAAPPPAVPGASLGPRQAPSLTGVEGLGVQPTTRLSSSQVPAIGPADLPPEFGGLAAHGETDLRVHRGRGTVVVAGALVLGGVLAWAATHGGVEQIRAALSSPARPAEALPAAVPATVKPTGGALEPAASAGARAGAPVVTAVGAPLPAAAPAAGPQIVQTPALERARTAIAEGAPDDAVAVLRPAVAGGNADAKPALADALVASGWNDVKRYQWGSVARKAREALSLTGPNAPSHGGHALLGEALYALGEFNSALGEFNKALVESPHDPKLKRRVIRSRRQLSKPTPPTSATAEPAAEQE
jgi:serine/threonine protein kinase